MLIYRKIDDDMINNFISPPSFLSSDILNEKLLRDELEKNSSNINGTIFISAFIIIKLM